MNIDKIKLAFHPVETRAEIMPTVLHLVEVLKRLPQDRRAVIGQRMANEERMLARAGVREPAPEFYRHMHQFYTRLIKELT